MPDEHDTEDWNKIGGGLSFAVLLTFGIPRALLYPGGDVMEVLLWLLQFVPRA